MMGEVLGQMRDRIANFAAQQSQDAERGATSEATVDEAAVDDDLARRLERLSKK
jgi:hypothetical protein